MPPPTKTTKKTMADRKAERQANRNPGLKSMLLAGQAGAGKTTLAATYFSPGVSKRLSMTAEQIKAADWIELKGALWIEADEDGLSALSNKKIEPEFVITLSDLDREHESNGSAVIWEMHSLIKEAAEAGAHTMVVDTATSFGAQFLERYHVDGGDENGFAGWMKVAQEQSKLLATGKALGLRQFWLTHVVENKVEAVAQSKKGTELDKAKATAQSVAGAKNYLVPALSGKKFPLTMNGFVSDTFWLKVVSANGKKNRSLHIEQTDGFIGKSRHAGILDAKEPADLWLIDQKIKDALG